MIPNNSLSTIYLPAPLILPVPKEPNDLVSNEYGGVALNNPTQGLQVKVWTAIVHKAPVTGGIDSITVQAEDVPPVTLVTDTDITQVSLAFDQNMRPFLAFVALGKPKMYWYDTVVQAPVVTDMAEGTITPRATLDDHRPLESGTSDICLVYVRDGNLCYRRQRDRYELEFVLYPDLNLDVINPHVESVAMGQNLRLQFAIRGVFYGG